MDPRKVGLMASAAITAAFASASAAADVLHVSNRGVDNATCGHSPNQACRSISRGIANATAGDTVLVGPGLYGDIDRDRFFNSPGDEAAEPGDFESCMLCIRKRVRVISTHGAAATRIEAIDTRKFEQGSAEVLSIVRIAANGVTFGAPGHGFQVAGPAYGLVTVIGVGDVAVGGNIAERWTIMSPRLLDFSPDIGFYALASGGTVTFTGNQAIRNQVGFYVAGNSPVALTNNSATQNSENGFVVYGDGAKRLIGNYASGNGDSPPGDDPLFGYPVYFSAAGFSIHAADARLEDNLAVGNFGPGFNLSVSGTSASLHPFLKHNASTGNGGAGILVTGTTVASIHSNNVYGNLGKTSGATPTLTGCGLLNQSGKTLDATGNFWGRATGPGADPADKAGPGTGCDLGTGSVTKVAPFATAEIAVVP